MKWYKCADEMPSEETDVLLCTNDNDIFSGYFDGDLWHTTSGLMGEEDIEYWTDDYELPGDEE